MLQFWDVGDAEDLFAIDLLMRLKPRISQRAFKNKRIRPPRGTGSRAVSSRSCQARVLRSEDDDNIKMRILVRFLIKIARSI